MSERLKSYNPADQSLVGEVAITPVEAIPGIVARAKTAAQAWRKLSLAQRAEHLSQVGDVLQQQAERIGQLISDEMGKPLKRGIGEVKYCGRGLAGLLANVSAALQPEISTEGSIETTVNYDPLGVCAAITPWNFPVMMPHDIIIPALMAGNAVVLKPSEETPVCAQAYVEVLNQFLPEGLLQIIHGDEQQGKALVDSDINMVGFTGSRAAGRSIMTAAAAQLKRIVLELGGKDPLIVLDDADIEQAAAMAVNNSFENAGQVCVSTERIYVADSIADQFELRVTELAKGATTGPMVNERQRSHVIHQIDQAIAAGATVLQGGGDHPPAFVTPTVLSNVTDDMEIMQAETFGPVACITRFTDIDDAIERANASEYALGAAVYGQDEERAWQVASQLSAGMIGINKGCSGGGDSPWVGAKQSGYGFQGSAAGHRQFAQVRVISKNIG